MHWIRFLKKSEKIRPCCVTRKALIAAIQQFIFNNVWILKCLRRLFDHSTFSKGFETRFKSNWLHAAITGTVGFEKALGTVKVIKDQIQYRSQSLLNLACGYFSVNIALSDTRCNAITYKVCSINFEPPTESPEQMQSQRNYGSFLSKSHPHGMILLTMLAQNRPRSKRQCFNRAICYFKIVNIKQGETTTICFRSRGKY